MAPGISGVVNLLVSETDLCMLYPAIPLAVNSKPMPCHRCIVSETRYKINNTLDITRFSHILHVYFSAILILSQVDAAEAARNRIVQNGIVETQMGLITF